MGNKADPIHRDPEARPDAYSWTMERERRTEEERHFRELKAELNRINERCSETWRQVDRNTARINWHHPVNKD